MPWSMLLSLLAGSGALFAVSSPVVAASARAPQDQDSLPRWIWHGSAADSSAVYLRKTFEIEGSFRSAVVTGSGDNRLVVYLNGQAILSHDAWEEPVSRDATKALLVGRNVLAVEGANDGGPAGLALQLEVDGKIVAVTDASWIGSARASSGWRDAAFAAEAWSPVSVLGLVGSADLPWSGVVNAGAYGPGKVAAPSAGGPQQAVAAPHLKLPAGFRGELVYTVAKAEQGSWVALCASDDGRLYASDQGGRGIYRITPATLGAAEATTVVEKVEVPLSGAQGLCWWKGALYANVQGGRSSGLWRITDANGDGALDRAEHLVPFTGGGEHGPHAIIPTADGDGFYFCAGNHTPLPPYQSSRSPKNWGEDLLLPRMWDANGHARGLLAPGGWIARCDLDGKNVEIVSHGYRNQYD
ncbi:MAG: heme-binding protein, partial [Planctomycetes bacterium]|nr:heme-binding protein [Planctomycetota bacterium]